MSYGKQQQASGNNLNKNKASFDYLELPNYAKYMVVFAQDAPEWRY